MSENAGWKDRLFGGLKKTSGKLTDNIAGLVTKAKLDARDLDDIEDALIASDLGPAMAAQIRDKIAAGRFDKGIDAEGIRQDLERVFQWFPRLLERAQQHAGLLSGGEQQMLAIGRAYMAQPQLLMLDEPSLGLSPLLTKEIFNIISRIRQETGTAVLVVEQNAAIALAHADYGYIMELGRIVAADSCAVLSQKADVREAYLGGHSTQGISGTSQRWKRRKTWR